MNAGRQFTSLVYGLIAVAWLSAFDLGLTPRAVAGGLVSTALCAALLLLTSSGTRCPADILVPCRSGSLDESAQFRHELFGLCAALKLSINFCERHPEAEPDLLVGEVEEMRDNLCAFVRKTTRPVRLFPRSGCTADSLRPPALDLSRTESAGP